MAPRWPVLLSCSRFSRLLQFRPVTERACFVGGFERAGLGRGVLPVMRSVVPENDELAVAAGNSRRRSSAGRVALASEIAGRPGRIRIHSALSRRRPRRRRLRPAAEEPVEEHDAIGNVDRGVVVHAGATRGRRRGPCRGRGGQQSRARRKRQSFWRSRSGRGANAGRCAGSRI